MGRSRFAAKAAKRAFGPSLRFHRPELKRKLWRPGRITRFRCNIFLTLSGTQGVAPRFALGLWLLGEAITWDARGNGESKSAFDFECFVHCYRRQRGRTRRAGARYLFAGADWKDAPGQPLALPHRSGQTDTMLVSPERS